MSARIKNKRYESVKDRITDAFITLLQTKAYREITVVDIVTQAGSGRVSFYRNFEDKDDVIQYYISRETDLWLSDSDNNYITLTTTSIKPYIIWLFEHMYQYRDVVDILIKTNKLYLLEDEFDKRFFARLESISNVMEILYKTGGIYKLFCYWAKTGYKETPQEVAELVCDNE